MEEVGFEKTEVVEYDPFLFQPIDLPGLPRNERIKKYLATEEVRIVATDSGKVYRRRVKKEAEFILYEIPDPKGDNILGLLKNKERVSITNLFLDPRGIHCIISTIVA